MNALTDASSVRAAFLEALRPPPEVDVAEWAERYRKLPTSGAAEAGPWDNSKTPYMVEVMRELSPQSPTQRIVFMKCARVGGTEAMNNAIGAYMDVVKCPILVVQPTENDAEQWSKDHLDPMIESTPRLRAIVTPDVARKKGNTILHKRYTGGVFYAVGANSPRSARRKTIRFLALDERDGYPENVGGEGDPGKLFEERTATYGDMRKVYTCGTPTVKGASAIEFEFLLSDQRFYLVPCPECGHRQRLVFSQVRWTSDPLGAEYVCGSCGYCIPNHRKPWMLERGEWVATYPDRTTAGFHISALYSPWVSWGELAKKWVEAQGDPAREQVFFNTSLGETWDVANAETWDEEGLLLLCEPLPEVPAAAVVLTAGVDVQDDKLVVQVDAWGKDEERWTLAYKHLLGDPSVPDVWDELDTELLARWPREGGGSLPIKAACVDNGGHHTVTAGKWCRARRRRRVLAIVGRGGEGRRIWTQKPNRANKARVELYTVGVDGAKEILHARLKRSLENAKRNERGGPGAWHFAKSVTIGRAYFDELTAEVAILEYGQGRRGAPRGSAKRRWVMRPGRSRNEAFDCSVYSYAALHALLSFGSVNLDRRPAPPTSGGPISSQRSKVPTREEIASERPTTPVAIKARPLMKPRPRVARKSRKVVPGWMDPG